MTKKITAIIIDDEIEARDILSLLLEKFSEIKIVDKLADVDSGIISFLKYKPDIVFLDIQMPKKNGFIFIDYVQDYLIYTTIIFITAYHKYAIEAIKHSAFDYLLKPVNQEQLKKTIQRYHISNKRNNLQTDIQYLLQKLNDSKKIKLNTRNGFELINPEDILYLEADGRYTNIYCKLGKNILSTLILKDLEALLQEYSYFLRISRSIIINTGFLSSYDRTNKKCVLFADSKSYILKISRDKLKEFERFI